MAGRILLVFLIATLMNGALLEPVADDERREATFVFLTGAGNQRFNLDSVCDRIENKAMLLNGFSITRLKKFFKIADGHRTKTPGDGLLDQKEFNIFVAFLRIANYCSRREIAKAHALTASSPSLNLPLDIINC